LLRIQSSYHLYKNVNCYNLERLIGCISTKNLHTILVSVERTQINVFGKNYNDIDKANWRSIKIIEMLCFYFTIVKYTYNE